MELDVGTGSDTGCEFGDAERAACSFEFAHQTEFLSDGEHVDALLSGTETLNGGIDFLIGGIVERLRLQNVTDHSIGILFKHQSTEDGLFKIIVTRGDASTVIKD